MRGILFRACSLILIVGFLAHTGVLIPGPVAAQEMGEPFSGFAEIDGPVRLELSVSPPIGRPRDTITVSLKATSQVSQAVAPTIEISLPDVLSTSLARYPAATTFDVQHNKLTWNPILNQSGDAEQITLDYTVAVADIGHPEQRVDVRLLHGDSANNATATFWIGTAPSATIAIDQQVVAVGQPVKLRAQPAGPGPYTQTWDLGDGRRIAAVDPEVSYALPGIYEIRLHLANPLSEATAISAVTVVAQPAASFSLDDDRPVAGQTIQFHNESGGERPISSHWYFGDGAESLENDPVHAYTAPGTYTVRLVISSRHGESEFTMPVQVGVNPVTDMVVPEQARTGEAIQVMGFADDTVTSLRWDMGDGTIYEGDVVTHTYFRAGNFSITLSASNAYGDSQVSRPISVEGGQYQTYLPFLVQPLGADTVQVPETVPSATVGVDIQPAPVPVDAASQEPTQVLAEQSGSTAPSPGGASAGIPETVLPVAALPPQAPLAGNASVAEQLLWYVNEARRLHGLQPLTYNYELSIAAQHHTEDMAQNADIMHIGTDGSRPAERQLRFGYRGAYGGEAVAWGWESPVPVVEFWVNSPPHRILILNPDADEVGVGFTADGYAPNIWYWAVEFGILP